MSSMEMEENPATQYGKLLLDLTTNSKPVINILTMMAEDYQGHAPGIVQTIERHLRMVQPNMKLPVLYLIDSIVKNVGQDYPNLFKQNIVTTFCGAFKTIVDDEVKERQQMFKLRQTWEDVFPQRKLFAIDVRCHQVDRNWPISALRPTNCSSSSIDVNPNYLNTAQPGKPAVASSGVSPNPQDLSAAEAQMRAKLVQKQKELLELQQKKIELEIIHTKNSPNPQDLSAEEAQLRAKLLQKQKELLELQKKKIELEIIHTKNALDSTRFEEMESAVQQEKTQKTLLALEEIAKGKTNVPHKIFSRFPTAQPQSSQSSSAPPMTESGATTSDNDGKTNSFPTEGCSNGIKWTVLFPSDSESVGAGSTIGRERQDPSALIQAEEDATVQTQLTTILPEEGEVAKVDDVEIEPKTPLPSTSSVVAPAMSGESCSSEQQNDNAISKSTNSEPPRKRVRFDPSPSVWPSSDDSSSSDQEDDIFELPDDYDVDEPSTDPDVIALKEMYNKRKDELLQRWQTLRDNAVIEGLLLKLKAKRDPNLSPEEEQRIYQEQKDHLLSMSLLRRHPLTLPPNNLSARQHNPSTLPIRQAEKQDNDNNVVTKTSSDSELMPPPPPPLLPKPTTIVNEEPQDQDEHEDVEMYQNSNTAVEQTSTDAFKVDDSTQLSRGLYRFNTQNGEIIAKPVYFFEGREYVALADHPHLRPRFTNCTTNRPTATATTLTLPATTTIITSEPHNEEEVSVNTYDQMNCGSSPLPNTLQETQRVENSNSCLVVPQERQAFSTYPFGRLRSGTLYRRVSTQLQHEYDEAEHEGEWDAQNYEAVHAENQPQPEVEQPQGSQSLWIGGLLVAESVRLTPENTIYTPSPPNSVYEEEFSELEVASDSDLPENPIENQDSTSESPSSVVSVGTYNAHEMGGGGRGDMLERARMIGAIDGIVTSTTDSADAKGCSTEETAEDKPPVEKWNPKTRECASCDAQTQFIFCRRCFKIRRNWLPKRPVNRRLKQRKRLMHRRMDADSMIMSNRYENDPSPSSGQVRSPTLILNRVDEAGTVLRSMQRWDHVDLNNAFLGSSIEDNNSSLAQSSSMLAENAIIHDVTATPSISTNDQPEEVKESTSSSLNLNLKIDETEQNGSSSEPSLSQGENLDKKGVSCDTCIICCMRKKNAAFVHGKIAHLCCCYTCGDKILKRDGKCPICRQRVLKLVKILC